MTDQPPDDSDDVDAEVFAASGGPNREEMVNEYLPEQGDWDAKTQLDITDPHNIALMRNYAQVMPQMEHWQDTLNDFTDDFVKARTSVAGQSRREYQSIFEAMYGATKEKGHDAASALARAFGVEEDDD